MAYLIRESRSRSFRTEREFGLIVGIVLVVLAGWWLYRGRFETAVAILLPTGSLLVLLALVWPRGLVLPNRGWMALAHFLSLITSPIVLGIVYFLVLTPIGVTKRAFGWDPLHRRGRSKESYWHPYPARTTRHYEKMY